MLRAGEPSDIPALAELWLHSFPAPPTLEDRVRSLESGGPHGGIGTVLLAEAGGRLAGACRSIAFRQVLAGSDMPMLGLAAVAVAPWARRRGIAGALCARAIEEGVRRGDVVSVLYPFRPAFYRRLGWGLVGELRSHRFLPESLPDAGDPEVELAGAGDHAGMASCYARVAAESNGLVLRDEALWRAHLGAATTYAFVAREAGEVRGYLLVRYGTGRSRETRTLHIREMVAEDEAVRTRLLGWVSRQRDVWRRVRYDAAPDEHFVHRLTEPRPPGHRPARRLWAETERVIRGPMLRILDVRAAFEKRSRWGRAAPFAFSVEVDDAILPENRGPHRFEFDGERVRAVDGPVPPTMLRVTPPALAQLWCGEIGARAAARMGRAGIDGGIDELDALLAPDRAFRLLDEF